MPTYEYRCEACGRTTEVVQSFSDAPLTTCETCGGSLRKVYAPVGIVFKGSGFYKTDSRSTKGARGASSPKDGDASPSTTEKAGADTSAKAADKGTGDAKVAASATKEPAGGSTKKAD